MLVNTRVLFEVGQRQFEQGNGRLRPPFLYVHERTGQLNQAFIKGAVRAVLVAEPEMFQHLMGFVEKLLVEAMEITEIMRVQFLPLVLGGHLGNAFALAHLPSLKSKVRSLKSKVTDSI